MENLLSRRTVCKKWDIGRSLFGKLKQLPDFPEAVRLGGRLVYPESALQAFVERHTDKRQDEAEKGCC